MPLGEFELLQQYFEDRTARRKDVVVGIGDDGAVVRVPPGMDLVLAMDTLVAGVHFSQAFTPEDIGYRALAVNLSDLAAMGASPAWATLALTLPAAEEDWLAAFTRGFFELAERSSVELVGGDITRGPLSTTVQGHGFIPAGRALKRSGAQPGDHLYVTGTLGDAAFALTDSMDKLGQEDRRYLLGRLHRPAPRVREGMVLRDLASSAIDLSDGLIADLGHILKASGVGARIEVERLPLSAALQKNAAKEYSWQLALSGGDDYELCFTVPPKRQTLLELKRSEFDCRVSWIGRVEAEQGLCCIRENGTPFISLGLGYQHF